MAQITVVTIAAKTDAFAMENATTVHKKAMLVACGGTIIATGTVLLDSEAFKLLDYSQQTVVHRTCGLVGWLVPDRIAIRVVREDALWQIANGLELSATASM
jgi:hypothetical protein